MSEIKSNSDLLKCENDFFVNENKVNPLLITKTAQKSAINSQSKQQKSLKTEKISSSVLFRAKDFLDKTKTNESIGQKCDLVNDETNECPNDSKRTVELSFVLFENNDQLKNESSDDDNDSTDSSDNDSEDESSDSEEHSDSNSKPFEDKNIK